MRDRGTSFPSLLLVLLIAAALYLGYGRVQHLIGKAGSQATVIETTQAVACRANRRIIERAIVMWLVDHPGAVPTLSDLAATGAATPTCPERGEYEIVGRQVRCTLHR